MTDFDKLRDILEMAELLTSDEGGQLEVQTVDEKTNRTATVIFRFNEDKELTEIYVEE